VGYTFLHNHQRDLCLCLPVRFRSKANTRYPLFLCFISSNYPKHPNCRTC
jgi:hypothetical protein